MNKKSVFVLVFLLFFIVSCQAADTITEYKVDSTVPLGLNVTATGIFAADSGDSNGELCSFYLLDANSGVLIRRPTDQYTTDTGRFTMVGYPINEPLFKRGSNYTMRSECGQATADYNFLVEQRETLEHYGTEEFEYLTNPGNVDTALVWGMFLFLFAVIGGSLYFLYKLKQK